MTSPALECLALIDPEAPQYIDPTVHPAFAGATPAGAVVARWHDDVHEGAYSVCQEQPCLAVKRVDGAGEW